MDGKDLLNAVEMQETSKAYFQLRIKHSAHLRTKIMSSIYIARVIYAQ